MVSTAALIDMPPSLLEPSIEIGVSESFLGASSSRGTAAAAAVDVDDDDDAVEEVEAAWAGAAAVRLGVGELEEEDPAPDDEEAPPADLDDVLFCDGPNKSSNCSLIAAVDSVGAVVVVADDDGLVVAVVVVVGSRRDFVDVSSSSSPSLKPS